MPAFQRPEGEVGFRCDRLSDLSDRIPGKPRSLLRELLTEGVLQSVRSALNPPPPPPDTIPEMPITPRIFSIAEMAKLPEGVFWQDVQAGDTLVAAAMGDSVEIGFDGWLPSGTKVDSGFGGAPNRQRQHPRGARRRFRE